MLEGGTTKVGFRVKNNLILSTYSILRHDHSFIEEQTREKFSEYLLLIPIFYVHRNETGKYENVETLIQE